MIAQPAGVPDDGIPDDCMASSVPEAVSMALAHSAEMENQTHTQGSTLGDPVTLPGSPDIDSTILASHFTT